MKSLKTGSEGNGVSFEASEEAAAATADPFAAPAEPIDFSKVEIEPLFKDYVDFETFSKSDFRAVKVLECEAVPKSKKLLKFVLDDGTDEKRVILSGIHAFYEPAQLIGNSYLNPLVDPAKSSLFLANVTFEPGCRNNWHIHHAASGGGQRLVSGRRQSRCQPDARDGHCDPRQCEALARRESGQLVCPYRH